MHTTTISAPSTPLSASLAPHPASLTSLSAPWTAASAVEADSPVPSARRAAVSDLVTVGPGVLTFGVILGIAISTSSTGSASGLLGSAVIFGGSAQLAAINVLGVGGSAFAAFASGALVNARIMLYGAALEPQFRAQPRWFRILGAHFILDQTYLSAIARPELRGAGFRRYWGWLTLLLLAVWTSSVAAGIFGAPYLPDLPHLGLVCVAMFIALLSPRLRGRTACLSALAAALVALATALSMPELGILTGTIAGIAASVLLGGRGRS